MAAIHQEMGELCRLSAGDFSTASTYFEKALHIKQKFLPSFHFDTSTSLSNIGGLYVSLGQYARAIEYYKKALEISERSVLHVHFQQEHLYNAISEA